ncbi:SPOR domain-containing protein [Comamonas sp. Y33R10-2]|uniref:SPOR domain-containing protein n=1 Tax=Comamonas sp. Y33R10-2 TaxID=2853257 RepID=UPI001C5C8AAB|nr:SPOR domain-containing protein [Comamonas sp. Y33R10-2]QXZ08720.1 SPOR domain-containing protein [Comamonas sp. Y33R10-2]
MLRIIFLLLVLGNAGYYLWSQGHLAGMGLTPEVQSEPQRVHEQIKPDALVLPEVERARNSEPAEAAQPEAGATSHPESAPVAVPEQAAKPEIKPEAKPDVPPAVQPDAKVEAVPVAAKEVKEAKAVKEVKEVETCYQASGIEEVQADSIRRALASKAKGDWELVPSHQSGRWMVYMGKFPDAEFRDRKRAELRLMNVDFDRVGGNFEPGLSLGRFSSEDAAQRQLASLMRQGVRSARVVQERAEVTSYALRLPKATASFKSDVMVLAGNNLLPKSLKACAK